jgi:hypothetical protein
MWASNLFDFAHPPKNFSKNFLKKFSQKFSQKKFSKKFLNKKKNLKKFSRTNCNPTRKKIFGRSAEKMAAHGAGTGRRAFHGLGGPGQDHTRGRFCVGPPEVHPEGIRKNGCGWARVLLFWDGTYCGPACCQ